MAAPPATGGRATIQSVLACRDVDDARRRFPKVINTALERGPSEGIFRAHWSPAAEFHGSLRKHLTAVIDVLEKEEKAQQQSGMKTETIRLHRRANGDFWGFACNKDLKIVLVNDDSPASRAGLKTKLYVLEANGRVCTKPSDAYGPDWQPWSGKQSLLDLELLVTNQRTGEVPKPSKKEQEALESRGPERYDAAILPKSLRDPTLPEPVRKEPEATQPRERDRDDWDRGWPAVSVQNHPWPVCELPPPGASPAAVQTGIGEGLDVRLVFVTMGGSNMSGRAKASAGPSIREVRDGPSPADTLPVERAYMLDARGRWLPAQEPVNPADGHGDGAGPVLPFARRLTELLPRHAGVFLIPCACGNTIMTEWKEGSALYSAAVQRAKLGAEACKGILSGVLWCIGEADTAVEKEARLVGPRTVVMCEALRKDVGVHDLPFFPTHLYNASYSCHLVNQSFTRMGGDRMEQNTELVERGKTGPWSTDPTPRVRCITVEGLTTSDRRHFDMKSVQTLGQRYAEAWWSMEGARVFPDLGRKKMSWGQ